MAGFDDGSTLMVLEIPGALRHHFETVSVQEAGEWIEVNYEKPYGWPLMSDAARVDYYIEFVLEDLTDHARYEVYNSKLCEQYPGKGVTLSFLFSPFHRGDFSSAFTAGAKAIAMEAANEFVTQHLKNFEKN